jgi:hypothetical protein
MQSQILSYDPETDITEIFHWDPATGVAVIETIQPIDELMAANRDQYASTKKQTPWSDGIGGKVASIPSTVFAQLQASGIASDPDALKKFLNDADNRKLRTRPGTL